MGAPFYAIAMDFQWVDIGKVPDYWRAIRSVLLGEVKNVSIPGKEVLPGIYTGLNVAVNGAAPALSAVVPVVLITVFTKLAPALLVAESNASKLNIAPFGALNTATTSPTKA